MLTEPLTAEQWESIGWKGRQGIEDRLGGLHYYRPTADGRIAWGGDAFPYHFGNRMGPQYDRDETVFARLRASFFRTFPTLSGVKFTHAWGGPVGITVRFVPTFGTVEGGRIHYGIGYSGHGVAPTYVGGEILRDLALGRSTERSNLCLVKKEAVAFPPEPLRYLAVTAALKHLDRQDSSDTVVKPPFLMRLVQKLEGR